MGDLPFAHSEALPPERLEQRVLGADDLEGQLELRGGTHRVAGAEVQSPGVVLQPRVAHRVAENFDVVDRAVLGRHAPIHDAVVTPQVAIGERVDCRSWGRHSRHSRHQRRRLTLRWFGGVVEGALPGAAHRAGGAGRGARAGDLRAARPPHVARLLGPRDTVE